VFLKSLTLKGFKSFAEPTRLDFEPGITVVVGPNGSGKSNLVDAVAWVLGAQGPRTVRSSKMEDVIFAGTTQRAQLGRAEVSLVIDNSSGRLPVDLSEITITRTLFRSGESEYALNGAPCRLLDIQELLSDTGVGRQQHVIVGQGQLDAVLSATPEERRLVVEEAAGVLKFRRRRERAERRLQATEANLVRLQDLLREVRRQLRPLERQAEAARRYTSLEAELSALRLHLAGAELAELAARRQAVAAERERLARRARELAGQAAGHDAEVVRAEAALSERRADPLASVLARLDTLAERCRGLVAVMEERDRSLGLALEAAEAADLAGALRAERDGLDGELREVESRLAGLRRALEERRAAQAALESEEATVEGLRDQVRQREAALAQADAQLAALRRGLERDRSELSRLDGQLATLAGRRAQLEGERRDQLEDLEAASKAAERLEALLAELGPQRRQAEERASAAGAQLASATEDSHRSSARFEALSRSFERAGASSLAGLPGVVGDLMELVEVEPGWEAAVEAALGESLVGIVAEDLEAGARALRRLAEVGRPGVVLALGGPAGPGGSGAGEPPAAGADWVRRHLRARRPELDGLLDCLLGRAVAVEGGLEDALALHRGCPGWVVVTREGHRLSERGWHVGATGAQAVEEAARKATEAARRLDGAAAADQAARRELEQVAEAEEAARRELERRRSDRQLAAGRVEQLERDLAALEAEAQDLSQRRQQVASRLEQEQAELARLEAGRPQLEAQAHQACEQAEQARDSLRSRLARSAAERAELDRQAAGLEERRALLARRRDELSARLAQAPAEAEAQRRLRLAGDRQRLAALRARVEGRQAWVEGLRRRLALALSCRAEEVAQLGHQLDQARRARSQAEAELAGLRELQQRLELDEAELRLRQEASQEALRRELDCEPEQAMAAPCPDLPPGVTAAQRARQLERELKLMGPVNPLALEELNSLSERHSLLEAQLEDVRAARRDLAKVIRAIDAEIRQVFAAAYSDVAENFAKLFVTLFPGGSGQLRLTDPEDLLATGIEVEARPPGRNLRRLALLSGGERSLVALAFLFAVFRSRPSPFYILDEVEAALDDVNLHRFLDLLHDFRDEAQLIVVSHQKRTMEAADCLLGVTMQPGGSTKVVTERVAQPA